MPRVARLGNGLITGPYAKMLCTAPSTYHLAMDDPKQLKIQGVLTHGVGLASGCRAMVGQIRESWPIKHKTDRS